MKKTLKLFIGFIIIYSLYNILYSSNNYIINYKIKNKYNVKEIYNENYYFEIEINEKIFNIQTFKDLENSKKVIKDIKYYKGNSYECILPIIHNDKTFTDVICEKDGIYYPYNLIVGNDKKLDKILKDKIFQKETILKQENNITLYQKLNNYLGLEYYKGVYVLKDVRFNKKEIFKIDKYIKEISAFVGVDYIVADYNEEYEFHKFIVLNLKKGTISTIISNQKISMYSYVQGVVDDEIYIIDTSNKKQYKINIKTKSVIEIGNEKIGIKIYHNQEWITGNIYDAIEEKLYFNEYNVSTIFAGKTYEKVDKVNNKYYYLYEKYDNIYNVYKVNVQNEKNKMLIFQTSNIDNIIYINDYVYYKDKNYIKYYHDSTGSRKILKYNEIEFNESLKFTIN